MGILKEVVNDAKIKISSLWNKSYIKVIVICVSVVVCFSSGLFTGCSNYGEIKSQLDKALTYNRDARDTISRLETNNRGLERTIGRLRDNERSFEDRYRQLSETYQGIRSAYLKLQEGLIQSELYNTEAKRLIRESLKLIAKEDNP